MKAAAFKPKAKAVMEESSSDSYSSSEIVRTSAVVTPKAVKTVQGKKVITNSSSSSDSEHCFEDKKKVVTSKSLKKPIVHPKKSSSSDSDSSDDKEPAKSAHKLLEKKSKSSSDSDINTDASEEINSIVPLANKLVAPVKPKDDSSDSDSRCESYEQPTTKKAADLVKMSEAVKKTVPFVEHKDDTDSDSNYDDDDRLPAKKPAISTNPRTIKSKGKESSSAPKKKKDSISIPVQGRLQAVEISSYEPKSDSSSDDSSNAHTLKFPNEKQIYQILMVERNAQRALELSAISSEDSSFASKSHCKSHNLSK